MPNGLEEDEQMHVNGDDSIESAAGCMSKGKSSWMLYDILKAQHSLLIKAAEGNGDELVKILHEPLGTTRINTLNIALALKFICQPVHS